MHGTIVKDVLKSQPMSPDHHIYVALTWSRTRSRKDKLKPNWSRTSEEKTSESWFAHFYHIAPTCTQLISLPYTRISPNTRRSNVFYPQNSVLCGAWFCEWNVRGMQPSTICFQTVSLIPVIAYPERTVLIGTLTPFDHGEVEDRSMLSLTSVLSRILEDIHTHNAACTNPADEWASPEHLWVIIFCFFSNLVRD